MTRHRALRARAVGALAALAAALVSCSDAEDLAGEICAQQIACDMQVTAQERCVERFLEHFDDDAIETCHACQQGMSCADLHAGTCHDPCVVD